MRRTALLLLLVALAATVALAGCGGGEEAAPTAETVVGELPESETTESTETATEDGEEGDGGAAGSTAAGMEIFAANCGGCHTLADAGTSGQVGPNLDDSMPDEELVVDRVTNGAGAMPAFASSLDEQQIADVAAYVSSVAGA